MLTASAPVADQKSLCFLASDWICNNDNIVMTFLAYPANQYKKSLIYLVNTHIN